MRAETAPGGTEAEAAPVEAGANLCVCVCVCVCVYVCVYVCVCVRGKREFVCE